MANMSTLSHTAFDQASTTAITAAELIVANHLVKSLLFIAFLSGILLPRAFQTLLKGSSRLQFTGNHKAVSVQDTEKATNLGGFINQFPPSRREAVLCTVDANAAVTRSALVGPSASPDVLRDSQLSINKTSELNKPGLYTPTGFSTSDIKALGSFPDYSVLSGVPHPKPCPDFDIRTAVFRPFRPFRWTYHQTMSMMKFEPDFWIELEQNYFERMKQRRELWDKYGTTILNHNPGSELACQELMEMVLQYVCIRYPHQFELQNNNTLFINRLLNTTSDLTAKHPLHVLFENIPEDFAIMQRDERDGMYYLKAGFICSSIGWTFGTHNNRVLRAIHTEVKDYEEKMAKSMDRYFSKMPTDQPIQRGSWFVEDHEPLFITPEEYAANAGTKHQGEKVSIEQCKLRADWQTLRRLPLSGAVVFNFKAIFTPMTDLRDEPYIPSLLYKQVTEGKPHLTEPKVHKHILPTVLEALTKWKEEQIADGVIEKDWVEETLKESPFYPGWEARWRAKSGFEMPQ